MTTFVYAFPRKYVTFVATKKGCKPVEFLPAVYFGRIENATFSTNDPDIIEALKKNPDFGSLISIREQKQHAEIEETPTAAPTPESVLANPDSVVYEESVTSAATATLWLQKTHGEVFSSSKVADMKIEVARKYNTIFPNWK